eukprot:scaffold30558_cov166-Skeletonema_menzelii.AAC.1
MSLKLLPSPDVLLLNISPSNKGSNAAGRWDVGPYRGTAIYGEGTGWSGARWLLSQYQLRSQTAIVGGQRPEVEIEIVRLSRHLGHQSKMSNSNASQSSSLKSFQEQYKLRPTAAGIKKAASPIQQPSNFHLFVKAGLPFLLFSVGASL